MAGDDVDLGHLAEYEDFRRVAEGRLDPVAYGYYAGGGGSEVTLRANETAWQRYAFRKRVLVDVTDVDTTTTVLGTPVATPVLAAPTAFHRLACDEGEVATARAVRDADSLMIVSTLGTVPMEDVAATGVPWWFQLYIHRSRSLTEELAARALAAGARALVLTVDTPVFGTRYEDNRNRFRLPDGLSLANLAGREFPATDGLSGLEAYSRAEMDPSVTWADLAWLRSLTDLPLVCKGITTVDDARRAVDNGVDAIVVSNHGGRQLDGDLPTAAVLGPIAAAFGDDVEVYVDGGLRHGAQVLTALGLGARAVLLGRPVLWGLAAGGEAGAARVLELYTAHLAMAMRLAGVTSVRDLPDDLVVDAPW